MIADLQTAKHDVQALLEATEVLIPDRRPEALPVDPSIHAAEWAANHVMQVAPYASDSKAWIRKEAERYVARYRP